MSDTQCLDPHCEAILEEYRENLPRFNDMARQLHSRLKNTFDDAGLLVAALEYRVKTEGSLAGKLELKGTKYNSLADITDIIGLRVITFYIDDVDKVASAVERMFDVDWENSVDKRKLHEIDSFGYLSVHYICSVPEFPYRFEIQIRTVLQHAWANMSHDTGYKSGVEVPKGYLRSMSRIAGMLELIDDEFSRLRTVLTDYRRQMLALVKNGKLDDVPLSAETFRGYLDLQPFDRLNRRIAAVNQAEIFPVSMMSYLPVLESFKLETLGDVQHFIDENSDDAYQLAISQLALTDLDILSSNTALQYLCLVYVLKHDGGRDGLKSLYDLINGESDANGKLADMMMEQAKTLRFMQ